MAESTTSTVTPPPQSKTFNARNAAMALPCNSPRCLNDPFSDARYGKGKRLHNTMQGKKPGHRCTGCGTER